MCGDQRSSRPFLRIAAEVNSRFFDLRYFVGQVCNQSVPFLNRLQTCPADKTNEIYCRGNFRIGGSLLCGIHRFGIRRFGIRRFETHYFGTHHRFGRRYFGTHHRFGTRHRFGRQRDGNLFLEERTPLKNCRSQPPRRVGRRVPSLSLGWAHCCRASGHLSPGNWREPCFLQLRAGHREMSSKSHGVLVNTFLGFRMMRVWA